MRSISIALLALLAAWSCENDLAEVQKFISKDRVAIETAKDIEMLYSDSAQVRVRVISPTLWRHIDKQNPRQEFPEGVVIEFLSPNHKVASYMSAQHATRYEKDNKVIMRDSVVWLSQQNEKLETEELIWDEGNDRVFTKKFVVIRRPEEIVYGYGFESNKEFTEWRINAIQGRKKVEGLTEELKN